MKINVWPALIFLSVIIFSACGKSSRDIAASLDKVDILFSQLKNDSSYMEYYGLIKNISEIIMANSKKSGKADTAILNNKALTWKEKYEKLNYTDYEVVEKSTMRMYELHNIISKKYPDFKTLSESENSRLVLLSKKYYNLILKEKV